MPLGNSHMGAMEFGGTEWEELQLNEETFWSGSPYSNNSNRSLSRLNEVRKLIFNGQEEKAAGIIDKDFIVGPHGMQYLTLGSMKLHFQGHQHATEYRRDLNIANATATTTYKVGDVTYTRTTFASLTDGVIIMHLKADKAGALQFTVGYDCPLKNSITTKQHRLIATIQNTEHEGIPAGLTANTIIQVDTDGKLLTQEASLVVSGSSETTIYISAATNYVNYRDVSGNPLTKAQTYLTALKNSINKSAKPFETLLSRHVEAYKKQFDRVHLTLSASPASKDETILRVANFAKKGTDQALVALMFHFGRYLLISSSQPGGQPANLQGIWNQKLNAPWDSKYTININTEMNYWPSDVTNLAETAEPLFSMIRDLSITGRVTARKMYDCNGWVSHHNTDIWRISGPVDGASWGMFPNGGAWLSTQIWQHYLYSGDKEFLKSYYPILADAARFYLDYLQILPKTASQIAGIDTLVNCPDLLVAVPSVSPEHGPTGKRTPVTAGCTMDNQIIFDALTQALYATEIVDPSNKTFADSLSHAICMIPPMQIGRHNQLQEWLQDADNPDDEHRHISHLYGLYPSNQVSPYQHPELFQAARNTLIQRGDMATGWSLGWKTNFWARMLDGNHAYTIISNMLHLLPNEGQERQNPDGRTFPNLFDAHPPFQIDGNFGVCAGIAEMLIQSHDGAIHVLPALPDAWKNGEIKGILARGGFVIDDMVWQANQLEKLIITSRLGGNLRLRSYVPLTSADGHNLTPVVKGSTNPNPFYKIADIKTPLISKEITPQLPLLYKVYEYDIATKPDETLTFVR